MKTFIFKKLIYNINTSNNRECVIYRVKNNIPQYIGSVYYTTGTTCGAESEVFRFLIINKYLPESYYNLSKNDWRGSGYYCQEVEDKGVDFEQVK